MSREIKYRTLLNRANYLTLVMLLCLGFLTSSCNQQARGFAIPEGDLEKGKVVYERLACNECHSISGIEWKGGSDSLRIHLGGTVSNKKSYGELVTSVINPSHKIARHFQQKTSATTTEAGLSKMKNYNEVMTVQELINLVTFLQSEYKIETPPSYYNPYHY